MENESLFDWLSSRPKSKAIICDIDDTICVQFDQPIAVACRILAALDRAIHVHYVTARPEQSRPGTESFLAEHRLPGWRNLHFCPTWKSTRVHKMEVIARLAKEHAVVLSVGDSEEEEVASLAAAIPLVRIRDGNHEQAWEEVAQLLAAASVS